MSAINLMLRGDTEFILALATQRFQGIRRTFKENLFEFHEDRLIYYFTFPDTRLKGTKSDYRASQLRLGGCEALNKCRARNWPGLEKLPLL